MSTEKVLFANTVLNGTQKAGILKADANGYYTVVLGALGITNSAGEVYVNSQRARSVFEANSTLMRRIRNGNLRGELGHPDPADYPNMMAFDRRVRMVKEERISHHISAIWLDNVQYKGETVLGILGKIKPAGPYGDSLRESLENPEENVTFSGRYFSNVSRQGGQVCREIQTVATWDYVNEPGIEASSKYASPTLENFGETTVYIDNLRREVEQENNGSPVTMESGDLSASLLLEDLGFRSRKKHTPKSMHW